MTQPPTPENNRPSPVPSPGAMPSRAPKPGPRPGARPAAPAGAPSTPSPVPASAADTAKAAEFGRVDEDGTVYVIRGGAERAVGSWQAGSPEEGLKHFAQRFADLSTEVGVLENRLRTRPEDANSVRTQAQQLIGSLDEQAVVGDLDAIETRLKTLLEEADTAGEKAKEAKEARRAEAIQRKEALAKAAEARKQRADLFVSIHADAFTSRAARGSSVFALSTKGATSSAAKFLAQTQNASDQIGGVSKSGDRYLDHTMFDMVQRQTIHDSLTFGKEVLHRMGRINHLHKRTVDQAGFAVLKAPDIPSILVETAFISNVEEERKLKTAKFQQEVAESILAGIKAYFSDGATLARRG